MPLAIMDGRLITEMRTAAVSAAATKLLASPDAKVLAILGSGVQARSHVEALRLVRQFEEIRVWTPTLEHAKRFAQEIGATAMSGEEAVRDADVIVTVISSKTPVLRDRSTLQVQPSPYPLPLEGRGDTVAAPGYCEEFPAA
ncbi:MAG TPA: NAD(P)-binding domain-containing protein [Blastocatellia bacterium]|nr:NAD(P)-binding domain-containing protein [Blastocatellia bacterium]